MSAAPGPTGDRGARQRTAVTYLAFVVLLGQPAVVVAVSALTPTRATLTVIVVGTALLAAVATRAFRTTGGSLERLGNFVVVLALVQAGLALLTPVVLGVVTAGSSVPPVLQFALVLAGYPIAYRVAYQSLAAVRRGE